MENGMLFFSPYIIANRLIFLSYFGLFWFSKDIVKKLMEECVAPLYNTIHVIIPNFIQKPFMNALEGERTPRVSVLPVGWSQSHESRMK